MHRHHILPRHAGGTNAPENIVRLSVADHAEAHRLLYEQHGHWQDYYAWKSLDGQISVADAIMQSARMTNLGKPKSKAHRKKLSIARTGFRHTASVRARMRESHLGMKHIDAVKKKIGASQIGKLIKPEAIEKYRISRSKTDGRPVVIKAKIYPTLSIAAEAMGIVWNVSKETARGRIRRMVATASPDCSMCNNHP